MQASYAPTVTSTLNYAADRNDGGEFSNYKPERSRQNLMAVQVEIRNARTWPRPPTLEDEGLTIVEHSAGKAAWSSRDWVFSEYLPSCLELVKTVTGAEHAIPMFVPVQRRVDYAEKGGAPAAGFVHLDFTPEEAMAQATQLAAAEGLTLKKAAIYNVWKSTTPPPQDYPLAVCDRRTISAEDHVPGSTVEYVGESEEKLVSPYVVLAPAERQIYYYFPDMSSDESLLFIGADLDRSRPLGCAHSAFRHPAPVGDSVPRASIEVRVLAIFE